MHAQEFQRNSSCPRYLCLQRAQPPQARLLVQTGVGNLDSRVRTRRDTGPVILCLQLHGLAFLVRKQPCKRGFVVFVNGSLHCTEGNVKDGLRAAAPALQTLVAFGRGLQLVMNTKGWTDGGNAYAIQIRPVGSGHLKGFIRSTVNQGWTGATSRAFPVLPVLVNPGISNCRRLLFLFLPRHFGQLWCQCRGRP